MRTTLAAFILMVSLSPAAHARRKPPPKKGPPVAVVPGMVSAFSMRGFPADVWEQKKAVEALRNQAEINVTPLIHQAAQVAVSYLKTASSNLSARLEKCLEGGLWAYYTGNYREAYRLYSETTVPSKELARICGLAQQAAAHCVQMVERNVGLLRNLSGRIDTMRYEAGKAMARQVLATSQEALAKLQSACGTSDPAQVIAQISQHVRAVERAILTGNSPMYAPAVPVPGLTTGPVTGPKVGPVTGPVNGVSASPSPAGGVPGFSFGPVNRGIAPDTTPPAAAIEPEPSIAPSAVPMASPSSASAKPTPKPSAKPKHPKRRRN
jgi:hypothetical protein